MPTTLQEEMGFLRVESKLARTLSGIADAVAVISDILRGQGVEESHSKNTFGDQQLNIDVESDEVVFNHLRACGMVKSASSEEQTECQDLGGQGYSVAFDPLDGSSIVGANFAVGSIFGIWPGDELIGRRGSEQAAAVYAVYGPRTVLVVAWPHQGEDPSGQVQEYLLTQHQTGGSQWLLQRGSISIKDKAVFAPANLRATAENEEYQQLVQYWMSNKYTLRYSGGMVPDVHHILTKGGGVFANPVSNPGKWLQMIKHSSNHQQDRLS
ncbi:hypothetical protein WJX79_003939 [Trebouxia sp. C0005]